MYKIVVEIPEGWEGYFSGQKMEIPRRRGGLREIPSVVGVWIFSGTTHFLTTKITPAPTTTFWKNSFGKKVC